MKKIFLVIFSSLFLPTLLIANSLFASSQDHSDFPSKIDWKSLSYQELKCLKDNPVKSLILSEITDEDLPELIKLFPSLTSLDLAWCKQITDKGLKSSKSYIISLL